MKKHELTFLLLMAGILVLTACDKDGEIQSVDVSVAELEAAYDDAYEEVDAIVESTLSFFDVAGRVAEGEEDEIIRCGVKTHDFENKTITIDFGDGCVGRGNRMRKGKIIITYTDRKFIPGSTATITFEGFSINDIEVEGIRTRTNVSSTIYDNPSFTITLENGKMTWPDGTFAERNVTHTRTWERSGSPLNDSFVVEGSSEGINRNGVSYTVRIMAPVRYKRACWSSGVFIPVEGIKLVEREGMEDVLVDYGDGTCDNLVTITVNGVSKEVEITNRK